MLLDDDLRVWMLEVNGKPGLHSTSKAGRRLLLHHRVKSQVVAEALTLVGFPAAGAEAVGAEGGKGPETALAADEAGRRGGWTPIV